MLKVMFAATVSSVALLQPVVSDASMVKRGLQWHYVGNPYTSCGGGFHCDDTRALEIWFTYPEANWANYEIPTTSAPCTQIIIPTGGFCLQFTNTNLVQRVNGNSLWTFGARESPYVGDVYGSEAGWSFSITVAANSSGALQFGNGWVMSASNYAITVTSTGGGPGAKDEVQVNNGGYASVGADQGDWTDPPVEMQIP
jgi:hypothetical protein